MKTKNLFLGLSLLAIAGLWTGCANDEVIDIPSNGSAIEFRSQGGMPQLRATGTTTEYVNAFVVSGSDNTFKMGVENNVTGSGNATQQALFWNFSIARSANGGYDYNPKRYFSKNAENATFFAYSPVSQYVKHDNPNAQPAVVGGAGAFVDNLLDDSSPYAEFYYTVPVLDNIKGETTQEDLLVAWTDVDQSGIDATEGTTPQKIKLDFKHALSRVFITGQNATTSDVIITNLQLNNLCQKGTATVVPPTLPLAPPTDGIISWNEDTSTRLKDISTADANLTDATGGYRFALAKSGVALKAATTHGTVGESPVLLVSKEQGMMVIPQTLVAPTGTFDPKDQGEIFSLRVDYKLSNLTQTDYITINKAGGFKFEPGHQYLINIVFTGREINFEIRVSDFLAPEYIEENYALGNGDSNGNVLWVGTSTDYTTYK